MTADEVQKTLRNLADPRRAVSTQRFFKMKKGDYGEDDLFIGVTMPELRKTARAYRGIALSEVLSLLQSPVHEDRLTALLLMVDLFEHAKKDPHHQEQVVKAYLKNLRYVNNWDLVDTSSPKILGAWLLNRDREKLYQLINSSNLWKRRVAMLATFEFIRQGESRDALALAKCLLNDKEDLIHKASGWMLREIGQKVSMKDLRSFLKKHSPRMPRTMLRYSIEKLPAEEKKQWLKVSR